MTMLDLPVIRDFIRLCGDGWQQGWHERNGGNLTCRLTPEEAEACRPFFKAPGEWEPLGGKGPAVEAPSLGGELFITTGSGKFFRNVELDPGANIGVVELNPAGEKWRILWGLEGKARPTSEFPSHIMNHAVRKEVTQGKDRVIYHAHPPHVIALTFVLPLRARDFSRALWQSATECPVVFPRGVGVVPWMVPGGRDIALATSAVMREFTAAVWAHHGLFCAGSSFDEAFGLMHTIEAAARIRLLILSTGRELGQTITDENLRAIAKEFGVVLNEDFLD